MSEGYSKNWCQGFCRTCGTGCGQHEEEKYRLMKERNSLKAEVENLTAERGHYKAGWDGCKAEVERLKALHAKDCAFLLNGKKPGRWDCDHCQVVYHVIDPALAKITEMEKEK